MIHTSVLPFIHLWRTAYFSCDRQYSTYYFQERQSFCTLYLPCIVSKSFINISELAVHAWISVFNTGSMNCSLLLTSYLDGQDEFWPFSRTNRRFCMRGTTMYVVNPHCEISAWAFHKNERAISFSRKLSEGDEQGQREKRDEKSLGRNVSRLA